MLNLSYLKPITYVQILIASFAMLPVIWRKVKMPNLNNLKPVTCVPILAALFIMLLIVCGCDQSSEIPTSESLEFSESTDTKVNAAPAAANTIPLNRFWNPITTDYLTIAQPKAPLGAPAQGHVFQGVVGRIFPVQQAGTVPLKLFWNNTRKDYLTTTANAVPPGYVIIRIEGFVFPNPHPDTVPLKLFWNGAQVDYLTTVVMAPGGYVNVRTEGYVYP